MRTRPARQALRVPLCCCILPLAFLACLTAQEPPASEREKAAKAKPGQFLVKGGNALPHGTIIMLAEEAKRGFLATCGLPDDWRIPVEIRLHGNPGDPLPARPLVQRLVDVGGIRTFILDLHAGRGLHQESLKRAVYTIILYELALRDDPNHDSLVVMPWLVDGMMEAADWRAGTSDRRLYRALFESGGLFRLRDLLALGEKEYLGLDGASRAAFRASSGVLVMALLDQPDGRKHFQAMLMEAAAFEGEFHVLLSRHFPDLNLSQQGLEKLWALQMANKGGLNTLTDILGVRATEEALKEALHFRVRDQEGIFEEIPLADWNKLLERRPEERMEAVQSCENALVRLSFRCFPSYRPILRDYQAVLVSMTGGKTGRIDETLRRLEETRTTMNQRAEQGRDYLDWFEITRARSTSGAFADYLDLKQRLRAAPYRKSSPASRYLDRIDAMFHQP